MVEKDWPFQCKMPPKLSCCDTQNPSPEVLEKKTKKTKHSWYHFLDLSKNECSGISIDTISFEDEMLECNWVRNIIECFPLVQELGEVTMANVKICSVKLFWEAFTCISDLYFI